MWHSLPQPIRQCLLNWGRSAHGLAHARFVSFPVVNPLKTTCRWSFISLFWKSEREFHRKTSTTS